MAEATRDRDYSEDEFSSALAEALTSFKYDSLKAEQIVFATCNLFKGRCFGGSSDRFWKKFDLSTNSKGVGTLTKWKR